MKINLCLATRHATININKSEFICILYIIYSWYSFLIREIILLDVFTFEMNNYEFMCTD